MAGQENLILIAVGPDKVGLIQKISEFIVNRGGNIEIAGWLFLPENSLDSTCIRRRSRFAKNI